ncbi:MAG: GNAT family N-acetyltransferase [Acidimicrobiales bacterium]|nr:GNAT family N-acetyltransferase [Acidimicrobiales bacterium]
MSSVPQIWRAVVQNGAMSDVSPAGPGLTVGLRAVEARDIPMMAEIRASRELGGQFNFAGPMTVATALEDLERRFGADGLQGSTSGQFVVTIDGTFAGDVGWRTARWGPSPQSVCPAIGIALLPQFRGRGVGSAAQRLFVSHLFNRTPANRIQADTAIENIAEQRALVKAGFLQEGIVRGCEWRNDEWHDHVLYGITRADWESTQQRT